MKTLWLVAIAALGSCGHHDGVHEGARLKLPTSGGKPRNLIEVKAYCFSAPDGFTFVKGQDKPAISGTYSREVGERLVKSLSKRPGFELAESAPIAGRQEEGKPLDMSVYREFIFPTEYEPPVIGKAGKDGIPAVTPATPVAFEKRDVGVFLKTTCRPADGGKLKVKIDFSRTAFLGFVNYGTPITVKAKGAFGRDVEVVITENRIEMPIFERGAVDAEILVNEGDFIAVSGFMPIDRSDESMKVDAAEANGPEFGGKNFVALIQVGRSR